MSVVAAFEAGLLAAIAALHVAWGLGLRWPGSDETTLVGLVVGYRRDHMPSAQQCFVAALAIFAAAAVVALLGGLVRLPIAPGLVTLSGLGATAVFLGRGVAGYLPAWRTHFPREPFATLDRRIYSPLCLCIAATCAILLFNEARS
jgi:Protein of unknown function (DUF3995)